MKEVTKPYVVNGEATYKEYEKGDFVWAARPSSPSLGNFSGLDILRIYQVESFTPPEKPDQYPHGRVTLKNRYGSVMAEYINLATEEHFKHFGTIDEGEKEYFISYLKWLNEADRFGDD